MHGLNVYALRTEGGDFIVAAGRTLDEAIETACSSLDLKKGELVPYDDCESIAFDMLLEQYGGACYCTSESGN